MLIFTLFLCCQVLNAQPQPPSNLDGEDLRTWLKDNWHDGFHNELGYSDARRKMYGYIDNHGDTITCVYSGFYQLNPYGNEITYPNPINTEHTVPQSFFSSAEPMRSDIHHLYPTYGNWNSERGNSPFREIVDQDTQSWMRGTTSQSNIPANNIDEYSESIANNRFEPREEQKGDLARAVSYFYTMYPQIGTVTDLFQLSTLCAWHETDPPSTAEMTRNDDVEQYQGNRNPYIDYPELMARAWTCPPTAIQGTITTSGSLQLYPNPAKNMLEINLEYTKPASIQYTIYSNNGKVVQQGDGNVINGYFTTQLNIAEMKSGLYVCKITLPSGENYVKKFVKL